MSHSVSEIPGGGSAMSAAVIRGAIVAALGGFLLGFDTVVISGANDILKDVFTLSSLEMGFTVAIAMLGTIAGAVLTGPPADRFGRKPALVALAVCYFVSAVGCGLAPNWGWLLAARFVGGLAIGGSSVVSPMYIAEIAPGHLRGRLVAVSQLNLVIGILVAYASNYMVAQCVAADDSWRWMLALAAVPSAIFFFLISGIPESPRWLAKVGRSGEALAALAALGRAEPQRELTAIEASLADQPGHRQERLFQRAYRKPIFLAATFAVFNQLTGINVLLYYAPTILTIAGAPRETALLQSVSIGATLLVFTIAAMLMIDRFGRRTLMLVGSAGMAVCLAAASFEFARDGGRSAMLLTALLGYIAFFAFSQGSVIWVFISEIFPNAVRAKGQALGWFTHWVVAAVVTGTFPVVVKLSESVVFGFFAAMMVLQLVFAWAIMPETKGGTLEDVGRRMASPEGE